MPASTAVHFFLELAVILAACRGVGLVAQRCGQPQVVGEMVAGVLLGPSLLGRIAPGVQHQLFPPGQANVVLYTAAQIGLVLYMFLIGLNFDANLIKHRAGTAVAVSSAGILAPLALGALLAAPLLSGGIYFDGSVTVVMAMMFLGASIATTAFPMLARIIYEKRLTGTSLGTLALACGAADDALSWCLLAVVLAIHRGSPLTAATAIIGGLLYCLVLLTIGRRALARLGSTSERRQAITPSVLSAVLMLLMICAWFTDVIGIYAIFGAFVLGVAMPSGFFAQRLTAMVDPLVTTFLLPLFFVYSGLNTQIGLLDTPKLWAVTLGILAVSIAGKGVACTLAARFRKVPLREAVALGALMNARGLIELILLNIGLQAGIITPTLFTILVLVAVVTTLMAAPIFELVYGRYRPTGIAADEVPNPEATLTAADDHTGAAGS
ncbi:MULTISPECIES: cation:proton antiporter [Mycobacterium]|uniref:Potassium transporter n=1 Tax=Mycobacterium kiyosense TaxID=2871094 RepID=A0A9P3USB6_9MYCO|nr:MULTISPECIES: cation:proton antiporter [Mycobacterium]BDB42724.1 potassium transporter [Mycobacterium kiyosense]BDE14026.1 potassium transporter [Mycobacterium sp. 20KCMC460]GLB81218.1 potassium transporter [Mycobacterium kiyosense]GLB88249.1 potassium transporter [Mycobacterium kiyosense]GLB94554.1 potassium transporter [Mycobacterium kiyosense]